jgi:hypothetical protein
LPREVIHRGHEFRADIGRIIGQVALYQSGDQGRFALRENLAADLRRKRYILLQCCVRLFHRGDGAARIVRPLRKEIVGHGKGSHGVIKAFLGAVAAPDVEDNGSGAATDSDFGAHAVGPEAVDQAILQSLRRS